MLWRWFRVANLIQYVFIALSLEDREELGKLCKVQGHDRVLGDITNMQYDNDSFNGEEIASGQYPIPISHEGGEWSELWKDVSKGRKLQ